MGKFLDDLAFHLEGPTSKIVVLDADLRYRTESSRIHTVSKGFRCDLASVPKIITVLAPNWQQTARSGTLHDDKYRKGILTRKQADVLFYYALRSDEVGRFRAWAMYQAVRRFAGGPWRRYRLAEIA